MKARYFLLVTIALVLGACAKIELTEEQLLNYGLSVRNDDYEAPVALTGVGDVSLTAAENLPAWITGVRFREGGSQGSPIALVAVKSDKNLDESRTAKLVLQLSNGRSVNLEVIQWPALQMDQNDVLHSANTAFEADWASAKKITLVTGNESVNGMAQVKHMDVSLPWDWEDLPACYLPRGGGLDEQMEVYKMLKDKADWSLVFNLTGIIERPNYNFFGLYNRYTGILRIFFYFTDELIPNNDTSDHMWAVAVNANLAEHISAQFALPAAEVATATFKEMASRPVLTTPLTDNYNPLVPGKESTVPKVGWWAFDVNMAACRKHDFFGESPLRAMDIQLYNYSQSRVLLNSVLQGKVTGSLSGKINLDGLMPTTLNDFGKVASPLLSTVGSFAMNTYFLKETLGKPQMNQAGQNGVAENNLVVNNPQNPPEAAAAPGLRRRPDTKAFFSWAGLSLAVGFACSLAGKYIDTYCKKKVTDNDLGSLSLTANLDLNAVMTTEGSIVSDMPSTVPVATMSMGYFKEKDPSGKPTGLGKGLWNLEKHPVVYVVKDAYWIENHFVSFECKKEYPLNGKDVYSYDIGGTKGSHPGFRLITFLDPTSIDGVCFNEDLFDKKFSELDVYLSYGVYPGSTPGYTDAYRRAAGLDFEHTWRLCDHPKAQFNTDTVKTLNLVRRPHTDTLFSWAGIAPDLVDVAGYRLSSHRLNPTSHPTLERRFYGPSLYYSNPYATAFNIDDVQFVYDPQVYLPYEEEGHKLYDPQVPDYVVSAAIVGYGEDGKDGGQESTVNSTLRFVPKIELVSYKDLPQILEKIQNKKMKGSEAAYTVYVEMNAQIKHIEQIVGALKPLYDRDTQQQKK